MNEILFRAGSFKTDYKIDPEKALQEDQAEFFGPEFQNLLERAWIVDAAHNDKNTFAVYLPYSLKDDPDDHYDLQESLPERTMLPISLEK